MGRRGRVRRIARVADLQVLDARAGSDAESVFEAFQAVKAGVGDNEELDLLAQSHSDEVAPQRVAESARGDACDIEEGVGDR